MRYRGGRSSIGLMLGKLVISEVLNSTYNSSCRVGCDIDRCTLCGGCEIICQRNALKVNRIAKTWTLNNRLCNQCLVCVAACPTRCLSQIRL